MAMQGKSILDICRADIDTLSGQGLSQADTVALAQWKDLMRDAETKIVTTAACTADNATALGITSATRDGGGRARHWRPPSRKGGDMMINLIALTMMCDANRVIILQWPGFVTFSNIPTTMPDGTTVMMMHTSDHHGLSHRNGSVAVGGTCAANVIDNIAQIDSFYAGKYSKLVHLINGIQEGGGSMLDNSMVMWLPELADGNAHNNNNLPIVIAGSGGGYLKQGQSINVDTKTLGTGNSEASCANGNTSVGFNTGSNTGNVPLNKLYVTLINALGKNVSRLHAGDHVRPHGLQRRERRRRIQEPRRADHPQGLSPPRPSSPHPHASRTKQGPRKGALFLWGRAPCRFRQTRPESSLMRGSSVVSPPRAAAKGSLPPSQRCGTASGSSIMMRIAAVSSSGSTSRP